MFGYYGKWDFMVVIIVRTFVFVESNLEAWIKIKKVEKLYKFEGKYIPLQGCMFNYRERV